MATIQNTVGGPTVGQQLSSIFSVPDSAKALNAASAANSASANSSSLGASDTEDRFLKLLVAQMRNQDPLNPMDNAQVTTQMAQISTVQGIEKLNQSMEKMAGGAGISSPLDAIPVIGRQLLVGGSQILRAGETDGAARAGFDLSAAADAVEVKVLDGAGQTVFAKTLGSTAAGMQVFEWGGETTPAGVYQLQVKAVSQGQPVPVNTLVPARVLGISQGVDGVRIELFGRPSIAADAINAIL
jgi:flagellar basal-body rod modification protein FlgD